MRRNRSIFLSLFTIGLAALAVTGCAGSSPETAAPGAMSDATVETENEETAAQSSGSRGEASFEYGDTIYTAELEFCALTESESALFHGTAYDDSGNEVGYLDGDFGILDGDAFGEARIDFGATGQFESTDEFVALGDSASNIVVSDFSDTSWLIIGGAWDQNGTNVGSTMLHVTC